MILYPMQESFDSVTVVTTKIRKIGHDLMRMAGQTGARDLASRAVQLCKDIVPSQGVVEDLLMTPKALVDECPNI